MAGNGNIVKSWPQEITEYDLAVLSPAQSMYELWQSLFCIATMASSTATLIYEARNRENQLCYLVNNMCQNSPIHVFLILIFFIRGADKGRGNEGERVVGAG